MKKLLVVLGVVAFGFAFTSCKKECKCTVLGVAVDLGNKSVETKEECSAYEAASKDTPGIKCSWK